MGLLLVQLIEGADHAAKHNVGDVSVEERRLQTGVSEELLDLQDVRALLQEVRSERVPQAMRRDLLGDARSLRRGAASSLECPGGDVSFVSARGKEPIGRPIAPP